MKTRNDHKMPNKAVHLTPTRVTPEACRFAAASVAPRVGVGDLGRSQSKL
jgi:hypothetical protein